MRSLSDVQQLRQEVVDDVAEWGRVGVYELVWSLRTQEPDWTDAQRVELAKQVAAELLDSDGLQLRRFKWPDSDPISGPLTLDDVADGDWLEVAESGKYPAFVAAQD